MARRARYDILQQQTLVQLQTLPGIDPAMAADLLRLGVTSVDDLSRRDPRDLYDRIGALDGVRPCPRVLDAYAAAIHAARTGEGIPWYTFADAKERAEARPPRPRVA
ncbi:MAG TPA: DUF4332 domain-containing protein [Candidatus Thermoplasmatota archaeon]|nr:DUF4332 domain-containing protein [Candidatus Thermoplasmatota archaeon]